MNMKLKFNVAQPHSARNMICTMHQGRSIKGGTRHGAAASVAATALLACPAIQFATMHFGAAGAGVADKSHRLQGLATR